MTKRKNSHRHCGDKKRYDSLQSAQCAAVALARDMSKRGTPIVTFLRAYKCQSCGGFHFGHTRDINWGAITAGRFRT